MLALLLSLAGCGESYKPDTYATRAVQQANKVEQGVIIGVRRVNISAEGTTGAATGAAAGAVIGAQAPGGSLTAALGGVSGALVGGLFGKAAESAAVDAPAFEYVVQTSSGELVSVTQREDRALVIGQKVLVIAGTQARVVADYTVAAGQPKPPPLPNRAEPPGPRAAPVSPTAEEAIRRLIPAPPGPPVIVPIPSAPATPSAALNGALTGAAAGVAAELIQGRGP
jgi:outer membrane lipoprotein SlyB